MEYGSLKKSRGSVWRYSLAIPDVKTPARVPASAISGMARGIRLPLHRNRYANPYQLVRPYLIMRPAGGQGLVRGPKSLVSQDPKVRNQPFAFRRAG
eukprot:1803904-Prymnesium_polylepis.1